MKKNSNLKGNKPIGGLLPQKSICLKLILCLLFSVCPFTHHYVKAKDSNALPVVQQTKKVTGVVKDKTGESIIGANVVQKGTTNGAVTDIDGNFSLDVPDNAVLEISYIGYTSKDVPVKGKTSLNIILEENTQKLQEVVVVGYGTQKREEITSSVSHLKAKDFNKVPVVNPLGLIEGRIAGLTIARDGGSDPNGDIGIQLRGVSSLKGNNQPLVIVDGVPGDMRTLNAIAPEDVASMDVLKDGSAAAIYGTRGNNGVIIVTTKRPQTGTSQIDYSGYIMHEGIYKRPDVLTGDEYVAYGKATGNALIKDYGGRDDAYDKLLDKNNLSHVHSLTATGGSEDMSYRASLNYKKNDAIAMKTGRETIDGSLAVNHWAFDRKLLLTFNMANSFVNASFMPDHAAFYQAIQRNPTIPLYNEDGSFYEDYNGFDQWNPLARTEQRTKKRELKNLLNSFKATYEVIHGLKVAAFFALEKNTEDQEESYSNKEYTQVKDGSNGMAQKQSEKWSNKTMEWTAEYNTTLKAVHNITGLLGYSYQNFKYDKSRMKNFDFLTDAFGVNNMGAGAYLADGRAEMESKKDESTLIAFFARANYNYDGKYLLSASLRREGSSKFGDNNKWAWFPSASAGWMISREGFMEGQHLFDMLKLRFGFGMTGSLPTDPYMSLIKYGTGAGGWNAVTGQWITATYGPGNNPNPDLKWEKSKSYNLGIDFGLWNNRISGTLDIYQRETTDLLGEYDAQQPSMVYDIITTNVGDMRNRGVELSLNMSVVKTKNFTYDASLTFSYEKNKLTSLSNDMYNMTYQDHYAFPTPGNIGYAQRLQAGHPVGSFFGYICDGIDADGKWIIRDLDGKEGLSDADRTFIGNGIPTTRLGLMNSFTFRNFDFSFFLKGMFDYDILNESKIYFGTTKSIDTSATNVYQYALKHKLTEDPKFSTYYLESGNFLKIDNVTLGYTFNFKDKPFRYLRLYGNVTNLATITGYDGLSPDINITGLEAGIDKRGIYPITRTFSFGVNVGF